ncbi:shufflon system plasmid conjugative transfer pilus tip adhesin PilV [Pseudomonas aeruginosa]|nr:shufflon system plasmid conjugative transfer pilus tip adhesin PilV [Pseudomonas aeruginosa]
MNRIALALCAALVALSCNAGDSTTLGALPAVNPRIVTEGTACSGTGLQGMNTAGLILSCQSGVWQHQAGATRIVTNTQCAVEYAMVFCATDENVVGGGGSAGNMPGCPNIAGFVDRNGEWTAPTLDVSMPFNSAYGPGWIAGGSHTVPTGDNITVYAV